MKLLRFDGKTVRVTDRDGRSLTGEARADTAEYGLRALGRGEESLTVGETRFFESDVAAIASLPTFAEAAAAIPPGRYRHFKGGEYEVLAVARHSETEEAMVVYRALYGDGGVWVRPAGMWNETVERDGRRFARFTRIEEGEARADG